MSKVRTPCVYCGSPGDTRDHAPPRTLLERPYLPGLFTVRACSPCNRSFSKDEEFFVTILSQIATAPTLASRSDPGGSIDRALTRAPGLDQRIIDSLVVRDQRPTHLFVLAFTERFQPKRWTHVQKGVFSYLIVRDRAGNNDLLCIMDLHRTAWAVAKIPNPQARRRRSSDAVQVPLRFLVVS